MTETAAYLAVFTTLKITSFRRLPLILGTPANGNSWTTAWQVKNGAFVQRGQALLRITSDADGQQQSLNAPLPGCLHIRIPDGRYVPAAATVAELAFGDGLQFSQWPPHQAKADRLRQENAQHQAHNQQVQQKASAIAALEQEISKLTWRRDQLKPRLATPAGQPGSAGAAPSLGPDDCGTDVLLDTIGRQLRQLLAVPATAALSALGFWQLFLCAKVLQRLPGLRSLRRDGGRTRTEAVELLYEEKLRRALTDFPELPEAIRQNQVTRWEEIRAFHLKQLPPD